MEKFSAQEVLEQAIQTERLGFAFYTKMAERFIDDPDLHRLFSELASKEQDHERTFLDLMEAAGDPEPVDWEEGVAPYLRAIVESEFFLGSRKTLPSMASLTTPLEVLDRAIAFEKEALLYFHCLRDAVSDPAAVDGIIREERHHVAVLNRYRRRLGVC